jgi:hypothetical protein
LRFTRCVDASATANSSRLRSTDVIDLRPRSSASAADRAGVDIATASTPDELALDATLPRAAPFTPCAPSGCISSAWRFDAVDGVADASDTRGSPESPLETSSSSVPSSVPSSMSSERAEELTEA